MRCSTQGQGQGQVVREGFPVTPSSKLKIRKGLWSPEEDEKLVAYIINNGMLGCSWAYVAKQAGLQRCGKSCRLRWINYLRPGLKRGAFSRQEERLIIKLQSILGNRWSQIAAHMPGRTDNEIKNYWNSSIKKTLKLKPHLFSTTNCSTNGNSNIPSPSDGTCNTNLGFHHAHDAGKLGHSARPYLDARPEGYKTPNNNGLNVVTAGENQVCVPGVLESNQEQVQYQKEEINQLISNFEMWINNDTCTQTHEIVSSHAAFLSPNLQAQGLHSYNTAESSTCDELIIESCRTTVAAHEAPASANYSLGSTVPATVGSECLKEKIENDGWSTSRSYRNTDNWSHVLDPGAYTSHEAGISIVEDCRRLDEKSTHQSWPSLSFRSEFGAPAIKQAVGQSNDFQAQDDCRDHLNLRYDVNLGIPKYMDIYSRRNSYQLPQIEGGGGVSDQWDFSAIPQEEMNSNPVLTILGGGSRQSEIECQGGTGQVTVWAHDDI